MVTYHRELVLFNWKTGLWDQVYIDTPRPSMTVRWEYRPLTLIITKLENFADPTFAWMLEAVAFVGGSEVSPRP